jgi:hypothetical protein
MGPPAPTPLLGVLAEYHEFSSYSAAPESRTKGPVHGGLTVRGSAAVCGLELDALEAHRRAPVCCSELDRVPQTEAEVARAFHGPSDKDQGFA